MKPTKEQIAAINAWLAMHHDDPMYSDYSFDRLWNGYVLILDAMGGEPYSIDQYLTEVNSQP